MQMEKYFHTDYTRPKELSESKHLLFVWKYKFNKKI